MQSIPETPTAREEYRDLITLTLTRLQRDAADLMRQLTTYEDTFAGLVEPAVVSDVYAVIDTLNDVRDFDPAYLAEIETKAQAAAADTHQRYLDHVVMGREPRDYFGLNPSDYR